MNIIEKIEIKHFRSFDGGKDQDKVKIDNLTDLNIFSGANDSGKSNVLRALNLFFNNEISHGTKFDKDRDFSKIVANRFDEDIKRRKSEEAEAIKKANENEDNKQPRDLRRSDEVISIKLFFNNENNQRGLPKKFWISKLYSQKNNFEGEYTFQSILKGNSQAQATLFVNSFQFEYVPAIKDKTYFSHLFEKLQSYLFEKEDKKKENKFSQSSQRFNEMLQSETEDLFQKFQSSSGVDANFHIPSTLVDFFRTLSVRTENDISLFDRGDGVQARFIPEILDEISKNTKKNIIWGFEEPENSYEAKNIRKIRDEFLEKFSKKKQIFITSHTKEFLSVKRKYTSQENKIFNNTKLTTKAKKDAALKNLKIQHTSSGVSIYRVWKNTINASFITRFNEKNNEWEKTCDDLGIIQEARIIENLQETLENQATEIKNSQLSQEKQKRIYEELYSELELALADKKNVEQKIEEYLKPILIVEDELDAIYKIAYLKIQNIAFQIETYEQVFTEQCPFTIRRAEGAKNLSQRLRESNTDGYNDKKLIGLFDFDKEGSENFNRVQTNAKWNSEILGDQTKGYYIKRNNHPCFYGMLLPIPTRHEELVDDIKSGNFESLVEVENLLSDDILINKKLVDEKSVRTTKYLKIKKSSKAKLSKILFSLNKSEFKDFEPLFSKIEELFEINSNNQPSKYNN